MFKRSGFQAGDSERMWVISSNIFFAGKFSEMRVTPDKCG